jgi:hypothetical protein
MKWVLCFLILTCSEYVFPQQIQVGEPSGIPRDFYPIRILGMVEGNVMVLRANSETLTGFIKDIRIEVYDSLSLKKKTEWNFSGLFQDRQQFFPEDVRIWNGQVCIFGSAYDKQKKENQLQVIPISNQGKLLDAKLLQKAKTSHYDFNHRRFRILGETGQDRLGVVSLVESEEQGIPKAQVNLYDHNFNEKKQFEAYLPFQGKKPEMVDWMIDSPGNLHVMIRGNKSDDTLDRVFALYAFPVMSDEVIEYQLDIQGKVISGLEMSLNAEDKLLVCGLIRDDFQAKENVSGLFYLRIDRETGLIESKGIHRMDAGFKSLFAGENTTAGLENFSGFKMRESVSGKGGDLLLVAENEDIHPECENDYRTGIEICHMHYRNGNILVVSFNQTGGVDWYQTISKAQHSIDDEGGFLSFIQSKTSTGNLEFLYNGASGKTGKADEVMENPEKSQLRLISVNSNGQLLEPNLASSYPLMPAVSWKEPNGSILSLSQEKGSARLIRFSNQ